MFKHHRFTMDASPFGKELELSASAGCDICLKRDDLYGHVASTGGTSVRKAEFLVPQLAEHGTTDLVIVGRHGSNYTLNLVALTARLGIQSHCILVDAFEPEHALWLSHLHAAGASTHGIQGPEYVKRLVEYLNASGRKVFVSSYEGTGTIASMGGYALMDELVVDLGYLTKAYSSINIYVPVDSATTFAGMYCRFRQLPSADLHSRINLIGVPVFGSVEEHRKLVASSLVTLRTIAETYGFMELAESASGEHSIQFSALENYGSVPSDERITFLKDFFKQTGVYLDPVYGFHAAATMMADAKACDSESLFVLVNQCKASIPYFRYKQDGGE